MDRAHIRSKGAGGSFDKSNILLLCREHHTEQHKVGWHKFCEKYPSIAEELSNRDWEIVEIFGVFK